jgi:hypothetical protein
MPCRTSTDVHEWTNEVSTVPARGPVNLRNLANGPGTPKGKRRPRGALLQLGAGVRLRLQSVVGSR